MSQPTAILVTDTSEKLSSFEGKNIIKKIELRAWTIHCTTGSSGFHFRPSGKIAVQLTDLLVKQPGVITIKSNKGQLSSASGFSMLDFITWLQIWSNQDFTISCRPNQIDEIVQILIDIEASEKPSVPHMIKRIIG